MDTRRPQTVRAAQGSFAWAEDSFKKALARDPSLRDAERLRSLAHDALDLPRAWTIVGYGLIVLFLPTTHEVGHAWTAWKLGDDTAKSQGRISLNPIRHLDPVGSVLVPAILLWRNSDFLFGWARPVAALTRPCQVDFYTDSEYLKRGITEWLPRWHARGWRRKGGALANADLWQALDEALKQHQVDWHWVRSRAGNPGNQKVDRLARQARCKA